jgi:hypothetical protein
MLLLDALGDDLLQHALATGRDHTDLLACAASCSRLRALALSDCHWRRLAAAARTFPRDMNKLAKALVCVARPIGAGGVAAAAVAAAVAAAYPPPLAWHYAFAAWRLLRAGSAASVAVEGVREAEKMRYNSNRYYTQQLRNGLRRLEERTAEVNRIRAEQRLCEARVTAASGRDWKLHAAAASTSTDDAQLTRDCYAFLLAQANERRVHAQSGIAAEKEKLGELERERVVLQRDRAAATATLLDAQHRLEELGAHAPAARTLHGWSELLAAPNVS